MNHRKLGRSGVKVSEICLGTMQFGWTTDEENSRQVMDAFLEAGGNFIDTADIYTTWAGALSYGGKTEEIIGRWIKDTKSRDKIVLATKVRGEMWKGVGGEGLSRHHIMRAVEDSLRRLQTDYVDLYQAHWVDLDTPIEETLRTFDDLIRSGKARYLGASNFPAWRLMEAQATSDRLGLHRFESYQPQYSLMERQLFEYEAMPFCKHYQVGVIPYSPLARGFLTGKYRRNGPKVQSARAGEMNAYANDKGWALIDAMEEIGKSHGKTIAQTALAWMLTNPVITSPIIGANNVEQLKDSLGAAGYRLSHEEIKRLNDLTAWPRNNRPIWD
jgi:aryl-alcohol dehydrogenase-like predicted oxidoreductase